MKTVLIIMALGLAQARATAQQQPSGFGSVSGVTKNSETNRPVAGIEVILSREGLADTAGVPAEQPIKATSDDLGRFVFTSVPVGRYRLWLDPPGFFWVDSSYIGGIRITVESGLRRDDIVFRIAPRGKISGRVLAATGEPLMGATIEAAVVVYRDGVRNLEGLGSQGVANLQGNFRLSELAPGKYYIRTEYHPTTAVQPPFVYFPGTLDDSRATAVVVRPGEDVMGIDFSLLTPPYVPMFTISGNIVGVPPSLADAPVRRLWLSPRDKNLTGRDEAYPNVAAGGSDGQFQIRGIRSGTYNLWTTMRDDAGLVYTAMTAVEVDGTSLAGVSVSLLPVTDVRGRILVNGKAPATRQANPELVAVETPNLEREVPFKTVVNWDTGEFTVSRVPYGRYKVLYPGGYVDIRQNEQSVIDGFTVSRNTEPLTIDVRSLGGWVIGVTLGTDLEPASGATVVLVSENQPNLSFSTRSDPAGQFTFNQMRPGLYRIYAWTELPLGDPWRNTAFMRRYEALGQLVNVSEGTRTSLEIRAIKVED